MKNIFFEQKKGRDDVLEGRMTAYARVDGTEKMPVQMQEAVQGEVSNLFAVQADCRQQQNMDDFLHSELGSSLKKGLDEVVKRLKDSGLWNENMDINNPKDDMKMMNGMAELVPIMPRVIYFENEEEALEQEGDVYFLGNFAGFQAASMCAQAFSLLYQFRFREQERGNARRDVDDLLAQIESSIPENENYIDCKEGLEKKLLSSYVPGILYSQHDDAEYGKAVERFRRFMQGYRFPEDIDEIIKMTQESRKGAVLNLKRFELLLKKIVAFAREDFSQLAIIQRDLAALS